MKIVILDAHVIYTFHLEAMLRYPVQFTPLNLVAKTFTGIIWQPIQTFIKLQYGFLCHCGCREWVRTGQRSVQMQSTQREIFDTTRMRSRNTYHPQSAPPGGVVAASASSRANARHGIAFDLTSIASQTFVGLHPWDLLLRSTTDAAVREKFIEDTRNDLHDAVSSLNVRGIFSILIVSGGRVGLYHRRVYLDITFAWPS